MVRFPPELDGWQAGARNLLCVFTCVTALAGCAADAADAPGGQGQAQPVTVPSLPPAPTPAPALEQSGQPLPATSAAAPAPAAVAPPSVPAAPSVPGATSIDLPKPENWLQWLEIVKAEAVRQGVRAETVDAAFAGLAFNPRVVALDRDQREARSSYETYIARQVTARRISEGRANYQQYRTLIDGISAKYGVPAAIIIGIWGMETHYGANMGNTDAIQALASLGYDGRRRALFTGELIGALKMLDQGVERALLRGSWAGALGHGQFLPNSFLKYAVDHDGDGRRNIWTSVPDGVASIANFLAEHGWKGQASWGFAVTAPTGFSIEAELDPATDAPRCQRALSRHTKVADLPAWASRGFAATGAGGFPALGEQASLLQMDVPDGPKYLTFPNYRVILAYNCSNFYALSVGLLGDAIANGL
jgi:membrane-bound lytic murein transglycosylase B